MNAGAAFADLGLAGDDASVFEFGFERDVGGGGRVDASQAGENLGRQFDGLGEIAGEVGQSGQEEVAEAVSFEAAALGEAILEELR